MSDTRSYSTEAMRATARKIRTNAQNGLNTHNQHWHQLQSSISSLPGFIQSLFNLVLKPHDQSIRDSFQWQMDYATQLEQAANSLETIEGLLADVF